MSKSRPGSAACAACQTCRWGAALIQTLTLLEESSVVPPILIDGDEQAISYHFQLAINFVFLLNAS